MIEWAFSGLKRGYNLRRDFCDWQRAVDADQSSAKSLLCARRSGKTTYAAAKLIEDGIPGEVHPFVAATQTKARDILWPILERYTRTHGVGIDFNRSRLRCTTDRGVIIQCMGLSTDPDIEKLRGERYPGVIFDECGAANQDRLKRAMFEAAEPATADFEGRGGFGIIACGTPTRAPKGFWYDICSGNAGNAGAFGFSVHRATIFDNPYFRDPIGLLSRKLAQKGWTDETPEFLREWLGQFCLSTDGLCYGDAWNKIVEPRTTRPLQGHTIVSLDFGESSPCAWTVVRITEHYEERDNFIHHTIHVHVLETREKVCDSLQEIASITRELMRQYSAGQVVGDSAEGFGIRQLVQQYGLPITKAVKSGKKAERIFMMRGMLQTGTLRVYQDCESLIEQLQCLPWNEDHDDHHQSYNDHTSDALHYAIELALQMHETKPKAPVRGSAADLELERMKRRAIYLNPNRKL